MKLEIKHLDIYEKGLFGIRVKLNEKGIREIWDNEENTEYLRGLFTISFVDYENKTCQIRSVENDRYSYEEIELDWICPLLLPLSDIRKEINFKDDKFYPINKLRGLFGWVSLWEQRNSIDRLNVSALEWGSVKHLVYWHFDVFGLIEKGLAIDINTIE